ncbi:VMP1 [Symbiodinium natans]|uniref:VMP1 protein n=1 Tax=Symbiodinium natans TaxID=878477 RepID=A0A812UJH1_9DINO|nr:VMP1 [Symbiodinium natans]
MMFLFPHVLQVVSAAESCHTTTGLIPWYQHPCKLDCSTTTAPFDDSTVTFLNLWAKVTIPCMLWGFGTAVGELPPYLVSKAARLSGSTDEEFAKEMEEAKGKTDLFSRMKLWTVNFTEKHGFLGIFLLASWPNAAFDMCGMCCGYLMMPFWTFFIATALGKGVVKVNGQAVVFVNLFGSAAFQVMLKGFDYLNGVVEAVSGQNFQISTKVAGLRAKLLAKFQQQSRFPPEHLFTNDHDKRLVLEEVLQLYHTEDKAHEIAERVMQAWDMNGDKAIEVSEMQMAASRTDGKISLSSLDPGAPTSFLKVCWELFVVSLVLYFVVSIMNQMAQSKQAEYDEAKVEERATQSWGDVSDTESSLEPRPQAVLVTPPPAYSESLDVLQEVVNRALPDAVRRVAVASERAINEPMEKQAKRGRTTVPPELLAHTSLMEAFDLLGGPTLAKRSYFADDGIHLNERGTKLLALAVFAELRTKVGKYLRKRADEAARTVPDNPLGL